MLKRRKPLPTASGMQGQPFNHPKTPKFHLRAGTVTFFEESLKRRFLIEKPTQEHLNSLKPLIIVSLEGIKDLGLSESQKKLLAHFLDLAKKKNISKEDVLEILRKLCYLKFDEKE